MAQVNIDKTLYNNIYSYKLENDQLINDLYASFNNFTSKEKQIAIEVIYNLKIINEEYEKYIVIYNSISNSEQQADEYITLQNDNFQRVAQIMTGDFNNWKKIMEFNNLTDPYLEPGTVLKIPRDL